MHKINNISEDYTIGEKLGSGAFGVVRKAVLKGTGAIRAIKTIKK